MITRSPTSLQPAQWQKSLSQAITDPAELIRELGLPGELLAPARRAAEQFPLRVTRYFVSLMRHGDPHDPLLRQVLPLQAETQAANGFVTDPVGDNAAQLGAGVLHKYSGRALLIATGACAIHCRYCFRRHYPYAEDTALRDWRGMLQRLQQRPQIEEVILSGGDPLSLSDRRLDELISAIESIRHVQRLRIHSRLPVVLPERITAELTQRLGKSRLYASLVLHANHPNELTKTLRQALVPLREQGVTLLNQAVLLAGVNDVLDTQVSLSKRLFASGILPYYLHLLDPVAGAAHFATSDACVAEIEQGMRTQLPGYLVPKIVKEIPGADAKTPLHRL